MNVPKVFEDEYENDSSVVRKHLSSKELSEIGKNDDARPTLYAILFIGIFLLIMQLFKGFAFIERVRWLWAEANSGIQSAQTYLTSIF